MQALEAPSWVQALQMHVLMPGGAELGGAVLLFAAGRQHLLPPHAEDPQRTMNLMNVLLAGAVPVC